MSRETSVSDTRKPATPEDLSRAREALASSDPAVVAKGILGLYSLAQDEFSASVLLDRFAQHPDSRVRMAAVDFTLTEAQLGPGPPEDSQIELLARLLPRFREDLYVSRCLVNRIVQNRLSGAGPMLLELLPGFSRPEWLLTAYGAMHPYRGYPPLRDLLRAHPGAAWEDEALKHLYRLDPGAAIRDFPDYLPNLADRKLWRVLDALGHEMTPDYIPLLDRLVKERDARVRRVGVAILRWLAGEERAAASWAALPLGAVERQELDAIVRGQGVRPSPPRPSGKER